MTTIATPEPVACSQASRETLELAARVAASDCTVLIAGESGTGKEVLARHIHRLSPRAAQPFIAINCAAIPETLLEAVLFGHEKGAFTGAQAAHPGKFEQAQGGTLLLDEISEMPLGLQAKLLRVLQEREVERIGGRATLALDVRVLATTNRRLRAEVTAARFREDLYYRLNVLSIELPALRERRSDIPVLIDYFVAKHTRGTKRSITIDAAARETMENYSYPGNVRQLESAIERAILLCEDDTVTRDDLPPEMTERSGSAAAASVQAQSAASFVLPEDGVNFEDVERSLIMQAMERTDSNITKAAKLLGLTFRTLQYRLEKFGYKKDGDEGQAARDEG